MPVYAWGAHNDRNTELVRNPAARLPLVECFRHKVPLLEDGGAEIRAPANDESRSFQDIAPQSWPVQLTDAPVDRQLPWKSFAFPPTGFAGATISAGLTLNGEIYFFTTEYNGISEINDRPAKPRESPRLIRRARSKNVRGPFSFLAGVAYANWFPNSYACIDSTGCLYHLFPSIDHHAAYFVRIGAPPSSRCVFADMVSSAALITSPFVREGIAFVVVTDDGKTYLRGGPDGSWLYGAGFFNQDPAEGVFTSDWIKVSNAIVRVSMAMNGAQYLSSKPQPTIVIPPPQSGGRQAVVSVEWFAEEEWPTGREVWRPLRIRITDPGDGYTSVVQASMSASPDYGSSPTVTLTPFTATPVSSAGGGHFVCSDGKIVLFNLPRALIVQDKNQGFNIGGGLLNGVYHAEPIVDDQTTNILGNAAASMSIASAKLGAAVNEFNQSGPVWYVIDSAKALHRVMPGQGVTLVDSGPWQSVTSSVRAWAGLKADGTLYTWGDEPHMLGDGSTSPRSTPTAICEDHSWVAVEGNPRGHIFYAVRKDEVCRQFDQPMEFWPDSYFQS
jgi:hypothetical protein